MDLQELWGVVVSKSTPLPGPEDGPWILVALGVAVVAIAVPPLWQVARVAVTIVHELGHAVVGVLLGRRFTGFVVSRDMSGHTVTVGRSRGFGRAASTWFGYPMPAIVGAALVVVAFSGWARTVLVLVAALMVVLLVFARSWHTVLALIGTALVCAGTWWFGGPLVSAGLCLGAGALLLVGAWRHVGSVARHGSRSDDPGQLAALTRVPGWMWIGSFVVALGLCTWWAATALWPRIPALAGA